MHNFRKLSVWHRAYALDIRIHQNVRRFPRGDTGQLRAQILRSSNSVPSNIVEACRRSSAGFVRYIGESITSADELETHLAHARDIGLLSPAVTAEYASELDQIRAMLFVLKRKEEGGSS